MKKAFALLFSLTLLLAIFSVPSLPTAAEASGDYFYIVTNVFAETCEITKYTGSGGDVVIPSELDGYTVTAIGITFGGTLRLLEGAFSGCISLKSVTIPDSVTAIGKNAFSGCTFLTNVTIPDSVTEIGWSAFKNCTSLTNVKIPNSVTEIGGFAFSGCKSLASVTIPDGVTKIDGCAFSACESLTSVTISGSVTEIGVDAFYNCKSLTMINVSPENAKYASHEGVLYNKEMTEMVKCPEGKSAYTVPAGVTSVDFRCSTSLAIINVSPENAKYASHEGVLYNKEMTEIIKCPEGKEGSYKIPNSVTEIGNFAFRDCKFLAGVTIPNCVTTIGERAFHNCTALTNVTIGNGVTEISWGAFYGCTSLASLTIPKSVTKIGSGAFEHCTSLASLTIPKSVTKIGDGAFEHCTALTKITIPGSVTEIGYGAFINCTGLNKIYIPKNVDISYFINKNHASPIAALLGGCTSLTDVYYGGTEEEWNDIAKGFNTRVKIHFNSSEKEFRKKYDKSANNDGAVIAVVVSVVVLVVVAVVVAIAVKKRKARRQASPEDVASSQDTPDSHAAADTQDGVATQFCSNCGYRLSGDSVYCPKCGKKL